MIHGPSTEYGTSIVVHWLTVESFAIAARTSDDSWIRDTAEAEGSSGPSAPDSLTAKYLRSRHPDRSLQT